ncbi:MAG: two pore domain potassium channel family protein [Alphaproteobacteria bacterium]|nr:two pore domain potassium channel family protein [Alphaproteobacteria bacterium]
MTAFIVVSMTAAITVGICCLIAYEIMRIIWEKLPKLTMQPRLRVPLLIGPIFLSHILSIWLYSLVYFGIENFTKIGAIVGQGKSVGLSYDTFLDCLYFSATTYTSLGFGDLTPTENIRMLAAAEVLNGLVLIAWTASFTYLAMEKFWPLPHGGYRRRSSDHPQ